MRSAALQKSSLHYLVYPLCARHTSAFDFISLNLFVHFPAPSAISPQTQSRARHLPRHYTQHHLTPRSILSYTRCRGHNREHDVLLGTMAPTRSIVTCRFAPSCLLPPRDAKSLLSLSPAKTPTNQCSMRGSAAAAPTNGLHTKCRPRSISTKLGKRCGGRNEGEKIRVERE